MGASKSTNIPETELLEWLEKNNLRDHKQAHNVLYNAGFDTVQNLEFCGGDLEQVLAKIKIPGDRAKIRQSLYDLSEKKSNQCGDKPNVNGNDDNNDQKTNYKHENEKNNIGKCKIKEIKHKVSITSNFIFDNQIKDEITRMDIKRQMIIATFDKHSLSHSCVRLIYFSYNNDYNKRLMVRIFKIDLWIAAQNDHRLSIKGPLYTRSDIDGYKCKEYFEIQTSMN